MGVFREDTPAVNSKIALSASLFCSKQDGERRWFFQDVHLGGAAHKAGIRAEDELLRINGGAVPESGPTFRLGGIARLNISDGEDHIRNLDVEISRGASRTHPLVVPQSVAVSRIEPNIGLLRISMFPGLIGIDVAREILNAVRSLKSDRLIIDLRGNTGGGLGCIRVMSLLTPSKVRMGYSVSRQALNRGIDPGCLPVSDDIPRTKLGLLPLLFRFAARDKSVAIGSEGLGPQLFHGRTVLLVNEHTASSQNWY